MTSNEKKYWNWFLEHWFYDNPTSLRVSCLVSELEAFLEDKTHVSKDNKWLEKPRKI